MQRIQQPHHLRLGTRTNTEQWAKGLVLKLLEATHGQWLYWNIQIHNEVSEMTATLQKGVIQREIEEQMELGAAGLLEEDHWMMKVNLDSKTTSGEQEVYWLLAIKSTWKAAISKATKPNNKASSNHTRRALTHYCSKSLYYAG
jgi:hypothetical protein